MIGRKIIIQLVGVILVSLLGFLTFSLSARFFGASILGEVNYYLAILGIILIFSDCGLSRAHIKFVSNKKQVGEKIGVFLTIKVLLLFISFLIASMYFLFFVHQNLPFVNLLGFLILLLFELFNILGTSLLLTFEGLQLIAIENSLTIFVKLIKLIFLILIVFFGSKTLINLSLLYFVEGLAIFILSLYALKRFLPISWNIKTAKKYLHYSLPFFVIYPLSYLQGNVDVVILKNFWSASEVGFYVAAISLTAYFKSLYGVLITLFFPKMSQLSDQENIVKMQQYTDMAVRYLLIIFIPILLSLHFFRNEFISLVLGNEFRPAVDIFSLSLLGIFILMISSPYDHLLYATGRHKLLAPLSFISVIAVILLQILLVPGLGAKGTMLANVIVWLLSVIAIMYLVRRITNIKLYFLNSKIYFVLFFTILTLGVFFNLDIEKEAIWKKIIFTGSFLLLFYLFLKIFRIISSADIKYLKIILNPKKLIKEGKQEWQ